MWELRTPQRVKLVIGILAADKDCLGADIHFVNALFQHLATLFGQFASGWENDIGSALAGWIVVKPPPKIKPASNLIEIQRQIREHVQIL